MPVNDGGVGIRRGSVGDRDRLLKDLTQVERHIERIAPHVALQQQIVDELSKQGRIAHTVEAKNM
jgi:phosphate uptake regulator